MKITKQFIEKYFKRFKDVFDAPFKEIIEPIDSVLESFLDETISEQETIRRLQELTMDYEFTTFKWILHHIRIDKQNLEIANRLMNINPNVIVYKYFEIQDYGFNLLSDIYEKEYKRISYVEKRAKLFRLNTLFDNEKDSTSNRRPKITTTIFDDHKYNYGIFDWGILTVYTEGEIWDKELKRYVIPKTKVKT